METYSPEWMSRYGDRVQARLTIHEAMIPDIRQRLAARRLAVKAIEIELQAQAAMGEMLDLEWTAVLLADRVRAVAAVKADRALLAHLQRTIKADRALLSA